MRFPAELIWQIIGDAYSRVFRDTDERRWIEASWQAESDLVAESMDYLSHIRRARNIFEVEPYAPYGRISTQPRFVQQAVSIDAKIVGGRDRQKWEWVLWSADNQTPSQEGFVSFDTTAIDYNGFESHDLMSGGQIITVKNTPTTQGRLIREVWELENAPSTALSDDLDLSGNARWKSAGCTPKDNHILLHPDSSGAHILHDQRYFSNNNHWRTVWRMSVTDWPSTQVDGRGVSVSVLGLSGGGVEIALYETSGTLRVAMSEQGGLQDIKSNLDDWQASLRGATEEDPVDLEVVWAYDAVSKKIQGEVWIEDERIITLPIGSIKAEPHCQALMVKKDLHVRAHEVIARDGVLWGDTPPFGDTASVDNFYGNIYSIDPPVVGAERVYADDPWMLAVEASVVTYIGATLIVDISPDYNGYAPTFVRIDHDSSFLLAEQTSRTDDRVTYAITHKSAASIELAGDIRVRPWYLGPESVKWIEAGRFSTDTPLPDADRIWLGDAKGQELDMHGRYGKLLGVPRREDSPEYLATLRGMQYGLLADTTPGEILRATNLTLQLPYVVESGVVRKIERDRDVLFVTVGERTYEVDAGWEGRLVKPGQYIDKLDALVDGAVIDDWKSNPDLLESLVESAWEMWGTFVVSVDGQVGLSERTLGDLQNLLSRIKPRQKRALLHQKSLAHEDRTEHVSDHGGSVQLGSTVADLIFDDHGTVVNNTVAAGEEHQAHTPLALDGTGAQGLGAALDAKNLRRIKPHYITPGHSMGWNAYGKFSTNFKTVDIRRAVDERVASLGITISRPHLRMAPDVVIDPATGDDIYFGLPHPYTLLWVYDGETDNLASYHQFGLDDTYTASGSLGAVDMPDPNTIRVAGASGAIFETDDYGYSWVDKSVATSETITHLQGDWAWGGNQTLYFRDASGDWQAQSATFADAGDNFVAVVPIDTHTYVVTDDGAVYRHDGSSWSADLLAEAIAPVDASFADTDIGWVATDDGLRHTDDAGANWSTQLSGDTISGVHATSAQKVWVITGGQLGHSDDAGATWSYPFESVGDTFLSVSFFDDLHGVITTTSEKIFFTEDGQRWAEQTISGATGLVGAYGGRDFFAVVSAEGGVYRHWPF